ncbi:uncharacterized protein BJ171DRAFT_553671 [Polychytrium aggregatum]|uniref:uncharacterized protein n=1 Tax=Polychytrium aggregatum TaxID=110093 RepID=UPI0022FEC6DC|nr:uncharacterized protein BJ171DRAFT_553671 [Polychytrium aggregatum]KAI9183769.1 hypothetical protein BJ171DRAFT_553671 [Polychytrium aggregatum]
MAGLLDLGNAAAFQPRWAPALASSMIINTTFASEPRADLAATDPIHKVDSSTATHPIHGTAPSTASTVVLGLASASTPTPIAADPESNQTQSWHAVMVAANVSRIDHQALVIENQIWVLFGMVQGNESLTPPSHSVMILDPFAHQTTALDDLRSHAPGWRYGHSAVFDPDAQLIYVVGGITAYGPSSEIWAFDLGLLQWYSIGSPPALPPLYGHLSLLVGSHLLACFGLFTAPPPSTGTWGIGLPPNPFSQILASQPDAINNGCLAIRLIDLKLTLPAMSSTANRSPTGVLFAPVAATSPDSSQLVLIDAGLTSNSTNSPVWVLDFSNFPDSLTLAPQPTTGQGPSFRSLLSVAPVGATAIMVWGGIPTLDILEADQASSQYHILDLQSWTWLAYQIDSSGSASVQIPPPSPPFAVPSSTDPMAAGDSAASSSINPVEVAAFSMIAMILILVVYVVRHRRMVRSGTRSVAWSRHPGDGPILQPQSSRSSSITPPEPVVLVAGHGRPPSMKRQLTSWMGIAPKPSFPRRPLSDSSYTSLGLYSSLERPSPRENGSLLDQRSHESDLYTRHPSLSANRLSSGTFDLGSGDTKPRPDSTASRGAVHRFSTLIGGGLGGSEKRESSGSQASSAKSAVSVQWIAFEYSVGLGSQPLVPWTGQSVSRRDPYMLPDNATLSPAISQPPTPSHARVAKIRSDSIPIPIPKTTIPMVDAWKSWIAGEQTRFSSAIDSPTLDRHDSVQSSATRSSVGSSVLLRLSRLHEVVLDLGRSSSSIRSEPLHDSHPTDPVDYPSRDMECVALQERTPAAEKSRKLRHKPFLRIITQPSAESVSGAHSPTCSYRSRREAMVTPVDRRLPRIVTMEELRVSQNNSILSVKNIDHHDGSDEQHA